MGIRNPDRFVRDQGTGGGPATAVTVLNVLVPSIFDEIDLSYSGDQVTQVVYKSLGITVAVLNLTYSGDNLVSVVRT